MKTHTTNSQNTFIEIAEDSTNKVGTMPPIKGEKRTIANLQFDMLYDKPYQYTSDEVLFTVFAKRKKIAKADLAQQQKQFFSKGQPCFRASPLTKKYGWGVHHNETGKIALYGAETTEYKAFLTNTDVKKIKAMRSKRK